MTKNCTGEYGFSLIELVIVMLIIAIGVVTIGGLFGNSSSSLTTNEQLLQASQHAQACGERLMTVRRRNGFDWFSSNVFSCGAAPAGFSFGVGSPVGASYAGSASSPCPSGATCRDAAITVTSTSDAAISSSLNVLLVNY